MKYALFPTGLMIFLIIVGQSIALSGGWQDGGYTLNSTSGTLTENSTETSIATEAYELSIAVTPELGILSIIIGAIALAAVLGIKVVGSGLDSFSVKAIWYGTVFLALWTFLSFFGIGILNMAPYNLGLLLYFILTVMYLFGILEGIGGSGMR